MGELFSVRVASEAWRNEAHAWIEARLAEVGRGLTGEIEQRRIRPWATQLVVPTDRGTVWFKANCPELAHEVAVHETLSQLVPDEVDVLTPRSIAGAITAGYSPVLHPSARA